MSDTATKLQRPEARRWNKPWFWLLAFSLILCTQISPHWFATPDSVHYLSMARSLATGHGLRNLGSEQWVYAPGYPVLVTPLFWVSLHPFLLLSALQWGCGILFMLGIYFWAKRLAPCSALFVAGLSVLNAAFWVVCRPTLSDASFMALMIWSVYAMNRAYDAPKVASFVGWWLLATVGALCLPMIRPAGVCLAPAVCLLLLMRAWRRRGAQRWSAFGGAALVLLLGTAGVGFLIWRELNEIHQTGHAGNYESLLWMLRHLAGHWSTVLHLRISDTGRMLVPGMFKAYNNPSNWLDVNLLIYLPLTILVWIGWWRWLWRRADALLLMFPFYALLHFLWYLDQGARYAAPFLPLFWLCLWPWLQRWPVKRRQLFSLLLILHLCVAVGYWLHHEIPRGQRMARARPIAQQWADRIRADPGPIASAGRTTMLRYWVSFMLNKPIERVTTASATKHGARWVLCDAKIPAGKAYERAQVHPPYELLRRKASASANP